MANRQAFGRRASAQRRAPTASIQPARPTPRAAHAANDAAIEEPAPTPVSESDAIDAELAEWKRGRKRAPIPWRQVSFMASACFGVAGFVLPNSINNAVAWPLYGLAAISFYIGIKTRRRKRQAREAAETHIA